MENYHIDPDAIDVELLEQANLIYEANKEVAETRRELEKLKREKELQIAKLDEIIRKYPEQYFPSKMRVTEGAIENEINKNENIIAIKNEIVEANYRYDKAIAASKAAHAKGDALRELVKLAAMDYFMTPVDPRNLSEEVEKIRGQRKKSKLRRRKRNGKKEKS